MAAPTYPRVAPATTQPGHGLTDTQLLAFLRQQANQKASTGVTSTALYEQYYSQVPLTQLTSQLQRLGYSPGEITSLTAYWHRSTSPLLVGGLAGALSLGTLSGLGALIAGDAAAAGATDAAVTDAAATDAGVTDAAGSTAAKSAGSAAAGTTAGKLAAGGLAGLLGLTDNWQQLLVRVLEALGGIALLLLGLQALTGTGAEGSPLATVKRYAR